MELFNMHPIAFKKGHCLAQNGVKRDCPFWQDGTRGMAFNDKLNVCAWRAFSKDEPKCEEKMAQPRNAL